MEDDGAVHHVRVKSAPGRPSILERLACSYAAWGFGRLAYFVLLMVLMVPALARMIDPGFHDEATEATRLSGWDGSAGAGTFAERLGAADARHAPVPDDHDPPGASR